MALPALAEDSTDLLPMAATPVTAVASSRLKRLVDIVGAAALLLVTAPLALGIALMVKLDSRGPVLLHQERCGYRGRKFFCLKFRSMHHGADEAPHRRYVSALVTGSSERANGAGVYKLVGDDRVTRVGRLLRRTSLDELPQLWNILVGDMSLVGPRPPLPYEVELYDRSQLERLECRPGLTGLWQVSGRNQLSYREMCRIDVSYIRDWSIGLDARILLRTVPVVLWNSGQAQ